MAETVPTLPSKIGNYEIVRPLGSGGMGTVFLGRDPELDRLVAIKMLRDRVHDQELLDRFFREARSAAALRHPNIITVYASGQHEFQPYIVMEYVDGESLADIIRHRRPITLADKLSYIDQLCAGLGFAHRAGIVHRDIKPANLMIDREGVLRILDFGIARIEGSGMTRDGAMIGTLNYMSPEQMLGRPVDHRSDIFAVGAVAYELLSYRQAFRGGLDEGLMQRLLHEDPPPLGDLCPGLPAVLEQTVMRALQKSPDHRFQNLTEMRAALADARRQAEADSTLPTIVVRPPVAADGRAVSHLTPGRATSPREQYGLLGFQGSQAGATGRPSPVSPPSRMPASVQGMAVPSQAMPGGATLPVGAPTPTADPVRARGWFWLAAVAGVVVLASAVAVTLLLTRDGTDVAQQVGQVAATDDLPADAAVSGQSLPAQPAGGTAVPTVAPTAMSSPREAAASPAAPQPPGATGRGVPAQQSPSQTIKQPASVAPTAPTLPGDELPREVAAAREAAVSDVLARVNQMYTGGDLAGALSVLEQNPDVASDARVMAVARRVATAAFDAMASAERNAIAQKATDALAFKTAADAKRRAEAARLRDEFVDAGLEALAASRAFLTAINEAQQLRAQPPPATPASLVASPPAAASAATLLAQEQPGIVAALSRWAAAYEDGDMNRLKQVFPAIRREAEQSLQQAFRSNRNACRSYDVRFGRMDFSLSADGRRVTVEVPTEYVCTPKTGQAPPAYTQRDVFFLEKQGNDWFITRTSSVD